MRSMAGTEVAVARVAGEPDRAPVQRRWSPGRTAALAILAAVALIAIFPLYWLLATSFMPAAESERIPPDLVPLMPSLHNFQRLFTQAHVVRWTLNSLEISVAIMFFHMLFDSMAGYAFARLRFWGRDLIFGLFLATLMIPGQVTIIPNFLLMVRLHLVNTPMGVILPGFADAIGIFLMRQYLLSMPRELEEAASVDGASPLDIYWRIMVPLSLPAIAAVAIFGFVQSWNDFLWPLLILQSGDGYTLPVGIATLRGEFTTQYGVQMAGGVIAAIPTILFFLFFQRYFVAGLRVGAVK